MARGPPRLQFAKKGANPTLATLEYITAALKQADGPVSRNGLLRVLASWGHATTRQGLNAALAYLEAQGKIGMGSKGIIWVPQATGPLLDVIRRGQRL